MRSKFIGYFPLTAAEYEQIWTDAVIVLDTNALLNLYRYSVAAREKLLTILGLTKDRIWLPYQVAQEFHDRRVELIRKQRNIAAELTTVLESLESRVQGRLGEHTKNAFFDIPELLKSIKEGLAATKSRITETYSKNIGAYGITPQEDPVLLQIGELYLERVGSPYTDDELQTHYKNAARRYALEVPPGYKDSNKDGNKIYGDYILWRQIVDYAKQQKKNLILVTEDNKEDWWWKNDGETLGPRPELRNEFYQETGNVFYLYKPAKFLEELGSRTEVAVSKQVVEELSNTSKELAYEEQRSQHRAVERRIARANEPDSVLDELRRQQADLHGRIDRTRDILQMMQWEDRKAREKRDKLRRRQEELSEGINIFDFSKEKVLAEIERTREELVDIEKQLSKLSQEFAFRSDKLIDLESVLMSTQNEVSYLEEQRTRLSEPEQSG
jgi:rRNA-processing protein FCF1